MLLASNPLIQVTPGLMIWTIVCFGVAFFVLKRWAFGPIQKIIDERRERIRQSLAEADNAREEARQLLEEHRRLIGQARAEAEEIRQEVRRDAELLARPRARGDRGRPAAPARGDAASDRGRDGALARADPRGDRRADVLAASKVTGKALDSADQRRLIDEAISSLDFSQLESSRN